MSRRLAIVYDSRTGTTKAAGEQMARVAASAGWDCDLFSVTEAQPERVRCADAICVGSWTQGLFFVLQHPTAASLAFVDSLGNLEGKTCAVFCTYRTSPGGTLKTLADRLKSMGARVTGHFRSRGPSADPAFAEWLSSIEVLSN